MNDKRSPFAAILIALSFLIAFLGCQKADISLPVKQYPGVEAELLKYFERFEKEGKARGVDVDLTAAGITSRIGQTTVTDWVGQCNLHSDSPNEVIISDNFWHIASDLQKEKIVFHELGHCFLNRGHRDDSFPDGRCKSIMRTGSGSCIDFYYQQYRDYYLDELFER